MTIRVCDKCGKQVGYTNGYTLYVRFDAETVLEKDVCKDCRKRLMSTMNTFFNKDYTYEKEEKHVGD